MTLKQKYGHKAKLWFTDTDSLVYKTKTTDLYEDFYMNKDMFDFNGNPDNLRFYDVKNKKFIGKMKHETKGVSIVDFVGLKSKMR